MRLVYGVGNKEPSRLPSVHTVTTVCRSLRLPRDGLGFMSLDCQCS